MTSETVRAMKAEEEVLLGQDSPDRQASGIPGLHSLTPGATSKIIVKSTQTPLQKFLNCLWGWSCPRWELRLYWMLKKQKTKNLALQTQGKLPSARWANGKWDMNFNNVLNYWVVFAEQKEQIRSRENDILGMKNEQFQEGRPKEDLLPCSYNSARFSYYSCHSIRWVCFIILHDSCH